jgi:carbon-monoxide dehydrogenase medium subunit
VVERDPLVRAKIPLLAKVMPYVGHAPIRARGTIGGSLANADPAAEIVLVAVTLGATLNVRTSRTAASAAPIAAEDFFLGAMTTALPPDGCLTSVRFPVWREARIGVGFHEVASRRSDFALVSAAAQVALGADGTCARLALGIGAATAAPLRLDAVAKALAGTRITAHAARAAVTDALAGLEPLADLHASAEYRRRAALSLAVRAIMDANEAAQAAGTHAR